MSIRVILPALIAMNGVVTWPVAADMVISEPVVFSELDGSSRDADGIEGNGVVRVDDHLIVSGGGVVYVDVEHAVLDVSGFIRLEQTGRIQPPPWQIRDIGPTIQLKSGRDLSMSGTSSIRSFGRIEGGGIQLKTPAGAIEMSEGARVEAHGLGLHSVGGQVFLAALNSVVVRDRTNRVMANGVGAGGEVMIEAEGSDCAAVEINGVVTAVGLSGDGGLIDVLAEFGGVRFGSLPYRLLAMGATSSGEIRVHAHSRVDPQSPVTLPAADISQDFVRCP